MPKVSSQLIILTRRNSNSDNVLKRKSRTRAKERSRVSASPRNSRHVALPPAYHLFTATFSAAKLAAANYRLEQGLPRLQRYVRCVKEEKKNE
ncbi:hypothetical protein T4B_13850 [Trichinella pseudospiralis]|uniref:Uncharacterized protein n=1 Tax=Trichinella pseudospiralis TaxID=6337 RepID=A0A0V1IGV7_TRIPS|nr:hypothetical protein T4B_12740 [Trichinella pseudospiralis]KRZ26779.1 hypothetical protein T4B_13850 [Trichinella pseudospiralis]